MKREMKNDYPQLVAFGSKKGYKLNVYGTHHCKIWYILGFIGNDIYINQICFTDDDIDRNQKKEYMDMFDFTIFCDDVCLAVSLATEFQEYVDNGGSVEDAINEHYYKLKYSDYELEEVC